MDRTLSRPPKACHAHCACAALPSTDTTLRSHCHKPCILTGKNTSGFWFFKEDGEGGESKSKPPPTSTPLWDGAEVVVNAINTLEDAEVTNSRRETRRGSVGAWWTSPLHPCGGNARRKMVVGIAGTSDIIVMVWYHTIWYWYYLCCLASNVDCVTVNNGSRLSF